VRRDGWGIKWNRGYFAAGNGTSHLGAYGFVITTENTETRDTERKKFGAPLLGLSTGGGVLMEKVIAKGRIGRFAFRLKLPRRHRGQGGDEVRVSAASSEYGGACFRRRLSLKGESGDSRSGFA